MMTLELGAYCHKKNPFGFLAVFTLQNKGGNKHAARAIMCEKYARKRHLSKVTRKSDKNFNGTKVE
jgi:hypothetical protein